MELVLRVGRKSAHPTKPLHITASIYGCSNNFKYYIALSLVLDKESYPSWVKYKAPTQEELGKYLDEDDDDLWDS